MMKFFARRRDSFLGTALLALVVTGLEGGKALKVFSESIKPSYMSLPEGELGSLRHASAWLNSPPLTNTDLKGKVVLVEFLTYTCINWIRTLPYVRGWAEKYRDKGLVVIGVHTPEFPFEKNIDNVRRALNDMRIAFPIAVDNNLGVWNGFGNQFWPAIYLIDAKGHIRHRQFGEGGYDRSEKIIQQLLAESGVHDIDTELLQVNSMGVEAAADWSNLNSAENYLGYERTENFISPDFSGNGKHRLHTAPSNLELNRWALSGDWTIKSGSIVLNEENGRIVYQFHARDLHLVMGPSTEGKQIRFRVTIDGKPPGISHGTDVDEQGNGTNNFQRMYQLIRQAGPISDHRFEIEFLDEGVEAFSFTFG